MFAVRSCLHELSSFLLTCLGSIQGRRMEKTLACQLSDPELKRLATTIPCHVIQSRNPKTADRYSRAFNEFHVWTARYDELTSLSSPAATVALYLEYGMQGNSPLSKLESTVYGIRWVHSVYGLTAYVNRR